MQAIAQAADAYLVVVGGVPNVGSAIATGMANTCVLTVWIAENNGDQLVAAIQGSMDGQNWATLAVTAFSSLGSSSVTATSVCSTFIRHVVEPLTPGVSITLSVAYSQGQL